jgi:hypothetical protein
LKFRMPFINDGKVDEGLEDIYENAHKYWNWNPAADKKLTFLYHTWTACYISCMLVKPGIAFDWNRWALSWSDTLWKKSRRSWLLSILFIVHTRVSRFSDDSDVPDGFMNLIKTDFLPQTLSCASYDALCEGAIT